MTDVGEAVRLRDGSTVWIRDLRPGDAPALAAFFARLSPHSLARRFLGRPFPPPPQEVERLCRVDGRLHVCLVAVTPDGRGGEAIRGEARYALVGPPRLEEAEAAVVVEDPWQGKGLGRALLQRLAARARANGIRRFLAYVDPSNDRILSFIRRSGLPADSRWEAGVVEVRVWIDGAGTEGAIDVGGEGAR